MRPKKFNFAPITGSTESKEAPSVSIYKNGQMTINKAAVREFGFDGKLINILWDAEKRALGWKIVDGNIREEEHTKNMRLLKANPQGAIKVSIGRLLSATGATPP